MHVYQNSSQIPFRNIDILGLKEFTELCRMTDITDRTKLWMIKGPRKCLYSCGCKLVEESLLFVGWHGTGIKSVKVEDNTQHTSWFPSWRSIDPPLWLNPAWLVACEPTTPTGFSPSDIVQTKRSRRPYAEEHSEARAEIPAEKVIVF